MADRQYVWGTRYDDDLVLRDRLVGTTDRFYALADYFQTTAIADISGVVQERYVYRAFGDVSYYDGSFEAISGSAYSWIYLYAGYPLDLETLLYQVRNRYYHSALGRWLSRDPLTDAERSQGTNLYWYVQNNAVNVVDPSGLQMGYDPMFGLWQDDHADMITGKIDPDDTDFNTPSPGCFSENCSKSDCKTCCEVLSEEASLLCDLIEATEAEGDVAAPLGAALCKDAAELGGETCKLSCENCPCP